MPLQSTIRRRGQGHTQAGQTLRARQRFGKYRLERRLAEGGFAHVYRAYDTIEGLHVALKLPHRHLGHGTLEDLCREVRLTNKLQHPNILAIKTAGMLEGRFLIAYPLGLGSLGDRLQRRLAGDTMLSFTEQMISAVAHAHHHRIIHCDLKPENFILFEGNQLKLTDFGIARVAQRLRTLDEVGVGTVGYVAPEQALGKPCYSSDVFSLGLILVRMWSGQLPTWPYRWPWPGSARLRRSVGPEFVDFLRRCLEVHEQARFPDAIAMERAFLALRGRVLRKSSAGRGSSRPPALPARNARRRITACKHCGYRIADAWDFCAWCGQACALGRTRAAAGR